jgi:hypothetical protein
VAMHCRRRRRWGVFCAASTLATSPSSSVARPTPRPDAPAGRARRRGHARHRRELCRDARSGGRALGPARHLRRQGLLAPAVLLRLRDRRVAGSEAALGPRARPDRRRAVPRRQPAQAAGGGVRVGQSGALRARRAGGQSSSGSPRSPRPPGGRRASAWAPKWPTSAGGPRAGGGSVASSCAATRSSGASSSRSRNASSTIR